MSVNMSWPEKQIHALCYVYYYVYLTGLFLWTAVGRRPSIFTRYTMTTCVWSRWVAQMWRHGQQTVQRNATLSVFSPLVFCQQSEQCHKLWDFWWCYYLWLNGHWCWGDVWRHTWVTKDPRAKVRTRIVNSYRIVHPFFYSLTINICIPCLNKYQ